MLKRSSYGSKKKKKSNSETKPTITSRKLFGLFYTHEPLPSEAQGTRLQTVLFFPGYFLNQLENEPEWK